MDSGGPAGATPGRVSLRRPSVCTYSMQNINLVEIRWHPSIHVQSSLSSVFSARLPVRRINWVLYDSRGINKNTKSSCLDDEVGGIMNCCVPGGRCRDLKQPTEKNSICKSGRRCQLDAPGTRYTRLASILVIPHTW